MTGMRLVAARPLSVLVALSLMTGVCTLARADDALVDFAADPGDEVRPAAAVQNERDRNVTKDIDEPIGRDIRPVHVRDEVGYLVGLHALNVANIRNGDRHGRVGQERVIREECVCRQRRAQRDEHTEQ